MITREERGWPGHYILANKCMFRRNTLIKSDDIYIVVSTVGRMASNDFDDLKEVGHNRYYETMAFYADTDDDPYHDANVNRSITFESPWSIDDHTNFADKRADQMHEKVVDELMCKLSNAQHLHETQPI
jgi:hypothetical protein